MVALAETAGIETTRRSVIVSFAVNGAEVLGLGFAAWLTGADVLRAQTAANAAEVAVGAFLLVGVLSSVRRPDETHPLGYGRERFFWSLFAALGIFVGGGGLALEGAVRSALDPSPVHSYLIGYLVLAVTFALDLFALVVGLRSLRAQAAMHATSLRAHLRQSTDPAAITVVVGGGCAVIGSVTAAGGLVLSQATGSPTPDTVAGGLIGLLLLAASVLLLQTNRELLSGRGVPDAMVREMSQIIAAQTGVLHVQDLFAVVVGPASLIVDGDVTFSDDLDVPDVEATIVRAVAALRERWPSIEYAYLTPVGEARPRRVVRFNERVSSRSTPTIHTTSA